MEGRIESAHRDTKARIYLMAVIGVVFISVSSSLIPHLLEYHTINFYKLASLLIIFIVGIYLCFVAYQEFKQKYHQLAILLAKKV